MTAYAPLFRIVRHRFARDSWYEVESHTAEGRRDHVGTAHTLAEARDLVRRLEAAPVATQAERDARTAADLAAARSIADRLQGTRRAVAAEAGPAAWVAFLATQSATAAAVVASRDRAAADLRAALAAYRAADEAADLL